MKLRAFWFLKLAEIEALFKRKEVAVFRGFLTTRKDNIRLPYALATNYRLLGRQTRTRSNHSWICGHYGIESDRVFSPEELRQVKDAAKQAWQPNCSSIGEYCGEKVELWEFGDKRDWKVRTASGSIIPAARGNVQPWLGI